MGAITNFIGHLVTDLQTIGLAAFILCVVIAGLMRMVSGGNERRITLSNMALTAAVIGLAIALLATAFHGLVQQALPGVQ